MAEAAGNQAAPMYSRESSGTGSTPTLSGISSGPGSAPDLARGSSGRQNFRTTSGRLLQKIKRHLPGTDEYMNKSDEIACGGPGDAIPEGAAVTAQDAGALGAGAAPELFRNSSGREYVRTTSGSFLHKFKQGLPGTSEYMAKSDDIQAGNAAPNTNA